MTEIQEKVLSDTHALTAKIDASVSALISDMRVNREAIERLAVRVNTLETTVVHKTECIASMRQTKIEEQNKWVRNNKTFMIILAVANIIFGSGLMFTILKMMKII